ncbi:enoyl-CoA hydratase-related protein [Sandaracinobacteroides saxicola]|uniref:Enoyl-CoA hydratase/isomerase family protein n=1 Tax=Sandaracinobacteroides saxicola TaxID=2759707 RepID=A0A7G5IKX2_9SPHN|nr:enoyl-CoA hydratase-related protein [Sandaracinobacteroides saxicola]QMW24014.1 enoyl-CoA hydratase/isomerase family protein [Sandaracinobacteroides saxicola]
MTLLYQHDARGIAHVTLDRPDVHNAFDEVLIEELTDAFRDAGSHAHVRAVVLQGNGPSLCAGADVAWMKRAADWSEAHNRSDALLLSTLFATIDACPKPVIAVAHGNVFGGGVGLVACADMAVAVGTAKFALSEVRLGLTPATISPFVLRAIGPRAARRWFLTGERFGAADALAMGLVNAVAEGDGEARATIEGWIATLLQCAPGAVADAKALIRDFAHQPITDELRADSAARIAARRVSAEGREGLSAFLHKRKPDWAR